MANIGFVGYSGSDFNKKKAQDIIDSIFLILNKNDVIVSGATNLGIPGMVYKKAKELGFETVGIMCEKGYDYDIFPVDKLIVVGNDWGDESQTFLKHIDVLYRIGGGKQSLEETKEAKKMELEVYEYNL